MDNPCCLVFPLRGLSNVFKKIKDEERLEEDDIQVLTCFIDKFSTVSTHEATVGEKIASQVLCLRSQHSSSHFSLLQEGDKLQIWISQASSSTHNHLKAS